MKTKLDNYRTFYEVASRRSFSNAAKQLYISQSAVSQSIKQLELDLDCLLFYRKSKHLTLTQEGDILYDYVKTAMEAIEIAEQKINNLKSLDDGTLLIGASDTITNHFLLPFLEQFHFQYPNIHLQIYNATSIEIIDLVKQGSVDIAFVNLPIRDPDLTIQTCCRIHDVFVASSKVKLNKEYTQAQIAELPLILLEKNSNSRLFIDEVFQKSNLILEPKIEIGAHELLLQFAKINLGIACVVEEFSLPYFAAKELQKLKLTNPLPTRAIGYIHQKHFPLSKAAQAFIALLNQRT